MVGMGGSSGWAARRTPDCSATGTTSARNLSRRRHNSSCEMEGSVPAVAAWVVNHVPDHSIRNGNIFGGPIHAEGDGMSASQRRGNATADPSQAEVVAEDWNPASPMRRMIVLTFSICCGRCGPSRRMSCQCAGSRFSIAARTSPRLRSRCEDCFSSSTVQSFSGSPATSPRLVLAARRLIVARIRRALVEIVDQVDNHMSAACLPREVVVIARQHVAVEAQANFHRRLPMPAP